MVSRNFTDVGLVSLYWDNPAGPDVLAEIRRTNTARDVRDGLLTLAYAVDSAAKPANGLCVVVDSRLSVPRLEAELDRFRSLVRPEVANRIHLVAAKTGQIILPLTGEHPSFPQPFMRELYNAVQGAGAGKTSPRITRQQVKAVLVERALVGLPPMTLAELRRQTRASHQTASAALAELLQLNVVASERDGPINVWLQPRVLLKLADEHAVARQELRYADPSGLARMPSAMADRLLSLRSKGVAENVAISGVLGAVRFSPNLNITASPRLDLSVYDGDLQFLPKLDAGLVDADAAKRKPLLVLHLQRDCRPAESIARAPELAARLDCLADLERLGLQAEAEEFAQELCEAARKAP